jgi:hypothetical protein
MRTHLIVLILPVALGAQPGAVAGARQTSQAQTAAQPVESKPEDRCAIEGRVFSAASGEPVKRASLILRRTDLTPNSGGLPISYSTATDTGGGFAMKDIEPGKYRLSVSRTGFVNTEYGARGPQRPGTTLSLSTGQHMQEVIFRLTPHAVIIGRVVDEGGEPLAYVQVQAMRYRYLQGRKQLMSSGGASTNDLGEYRMFGIPPGRYYLSATYRANMMFEATVDRSATQPADEDYVPTYYPAATDASGATAVDVAAGAQVRGIDFTLSKTRTVHIKGRVVNSTGIGRKQATLFLTPRDQMGMYNMNRPFSTDSTGAFEVRGLAPGAYSLTASIYDGDRSMSMRQPIEAGGNIDNLVVTMQPGFELSGQIRVDGEAKMNLSDVRVNLRPRDPSGPMMFAPASNGRVKEDGAFTLSNVTMDHFNVTVYSLPEGFYVKSIRRGDDDVLASGLDVSKGSTGPIDIVLSPKAGQVEGSVQNDKQQPATGASVVLIPQEKERADQMAYYKTVTTDQYGRFAVKSVDPGEYKVYAWEDLEAGAYMDPEFMKPLDGRGESVTIRESSKESLQLKLIPAETASTQGAAPSH